MPHRKSVSKHLHALSSFPRSRSSREYLEVLLLRPSFHHTVMGGGSRPIPIVPVPGSERVGVPVSLL